MHTPLDLCDKLGLIPSSEQYDLLSILADCPRRFEASDNATHETTRAVAIIALWRTLLIPGARSIVLAPDDQTAVDFMDFLERVCKRCSPALAEVTSFPRWNVLQFSGQPGWEVRLMPNNAKFVAECAPQSLVSIMLSARSSSMAYVEACKALEQHSTHPKCMLLRVW